ncbi:MAG: hypothetical protein LBL98_07530 [Ruminococcus sp.]|jgi:hypothetical protein|nr:hypothetical protein [Ruminococcus sp.]
MKAEDIMKKAAERGITIDAAESEKYVNLSDEELENLSVSGGCPKDVNTSAPPVGNCPKKSPPTVNYCEECDNWGEIPVSSIPGKQYKYYGCYVYQQQ